MPEKMRAVMRWAGPRMMLYHPIEAIRHLIREKFYNQESMRPALLISTLWNW